MAPMSAIRTTKITETVGQRENDVSAEGIVTHFLVDVLVV